MLKKKIDSHSLKFFMRIHFMSQHFYHTKHVNHERSNEINLKGGKRTSAKSYEREEKDHYIEVVSFSDEKIVVRVLNQRAIARSRGN